MTNNLNSAPRILDYLPKGDRLFWTSGESGVLSLLRHRTTRRWINPFWGVSEADPDVAPEPVSGKGRVFTFTVNEQRFRKEVEGDYVIAIVELDEQEDLRLVTNIVNCEPDEVEIGMRVRVAFQRQGDVFVPVFEPDR